MNPEKYGRELDLILLLSDNNSYTAQELADSLGVTRRNLYYYFNHLSEYGFTIIKQGTRYRLDRHSPFFRKLYENFSLNEQEALCLHRLLASVDKSDMVARSARVKLERQFNIPETDNPLIQRQMAHNARQLNEAISTQRVVKICGYSSPHSRTVSDRIVEPFLFLNNENDIRAYEISSHMNKTYKLSRMSDVVILDVSWLYADAHKQVYTDLFLFSGEERWPVKLRLGQLSHNLMLEEYPASVDFMRPDGDNHWLLETDVVSFLGVGRFVLGLLDDIEVMGGDDFRTYLKSKIANYQHMPL